MVLPGRGGLSKRRSSKGRDPTPRYKLTGFLAARTTSVLLLGTGLLFLLTLGISLWTGVVSDKYVVKQVISVLKAIFVSALVAELAVRLDISL